MRGVLALLVCVGCSAAEDPCGEPGTACTIAGIGEAAFNGDGLPARETALYLPSQVRRGPDGLLYIVDFNNHRIRRIEGDGTVSTIAGDGFHAGAIVGAPAVESPLENPIDLDFLPDGRLVFVSLHDPRILVIDHDGTLRLLAGDGALGVFGNEGDGGPAVEARFIALTGIDVAPDGTVYVADADAHRVRAIRDGMIETVAGVGWAGFRGDGGLGTAAALDAPSGLATDSAGNLYIADARNCAVRKLGTDRIISTVAGTGTCGSELAYTAGVAVDDDGTLFIADRGTHRVCRVSPDRVMTTLGGEGAVGAVSRVELDDDGGLVIADQTNHRIRKIAAPL